MLEYSIYNEDEIMEISKKIHEDYPIFFGENTSPKTIIKKMAKLLSNHNINEENKLKILECAARIKYELKLDIDTNYSLSLNRYYFRFKKNDFIIKMAIALNEERDRKFLYCLPHIVQTSLNKAIIKTTTKDEYALKMTKK